MAVLLLWCQVIDSKIGSRWMGKEIFTLPSSLLDLNLYPLSLIHFPCLLQIVTYLCIGPRSSEGYNCYSINPPPRIIKQMAWDLFLRLPRGGIYVYYFLVSYVYGGVVAGGASY